MPDGKFSGLLTRPSPIGSSEAELSALLRAWRRRLTLDDLPNFVRYPHRRRQTVSQDDIARVVGSTSFWYGELERGRLGRYSDDFLDRVAEALRLSEPEREVLYRLAVGRQPVRRPRPADAEEVTQTVQRLVSVQRCPAFIVDSTFTVRAWNTQAGSWFPGLILDDANLMRWAFTHPEARRQLASWEEDWAPSLLAQLRMAHAREPNHGALAQLIREVTAGNEHARWFWENEPSVVDTGKAVRGIRILGRSTPIKVEVITCSPLGYPGIKMVILVPVEPDYAPEGVLTAAALAAPATARDCAA
ncbi:helix-turn-helix transcriptional regulator [Micromonospora sp. NPDC048063]|uniref:helix-turn-helix transcriptional regulator n=1 Tax=Micromonospora sp. NPDC048063 TaxID=3364256 RepID=UPI0037232533